MKRKARHHPRLLAVAPILLVLAVAAFFRLWRIGSVPPGLFGDEAVNGLDALDVLAGRGQVFFPANYGREGLHMYFIAAFFRVLGVTPLAVRLPSVLAGILTTLATYWLGHELFRYSDEGVKARVPLLAALGLATAYWHVHFSRFGIRGVFTPLWGALAFAAFWRGVNTLDTVSKGRSLGWFLLSGAFLGLSVHFYTASRLYPVMLGLFLVVQAAVAARGEGGARGSVLGRAFWPIAGCYLVAAVVFSPLGWHFVTHPGSFAQRASEVFAFGDQVSPWARMRLAVIGNVAQFFVPGGGDMAWFYNLPGRPLLDLVTGALTLMGLAIAIRRWRRPEYLFLLVWWPVMMLPAFLAVDRVPTAPRVLGVMPGLYLFPAIAVASLANWARTRIEQDRARQAVVATLMIIPLVAAGAWTARDYFAAWAPTAEAYEAFDGEMVDAANWLRDHPRPWPVYVSAEFYRHASFMLLHSQVPTTEFFAYRDDSVRWFKGSSTLPLPPPGVTGTYVFTGIAHTSEERLDQYLPERQLVYQSLDPAGRPSVTVYAANTRDRAQNDVDRPVTDQVTLTGYDVYGEARPGQALECALHWRFDGPQENGQTAYRVQLALVDENGRLWPAAEDDLGYRPVEWDGDAEAVSWHRLSLPAEAPLGAYKVAVLFADGESRAALGEWIEVSPSEPSLRTDVEPLALFGDSLRLLEAQVRVETVVGGEKLAVELVMDSTAPLPRSYTLFLHALDSDGQRVGQRDSATGGGLFPSDAWKPGQPLRDVYLVPIDVAGGRQPYRLALGFYDWQTGERLVALFPTGARLSDDQFLLGP